MKLRKLLQTAKNKLEKKNLREIVEECKNIDITRGIDFMQEKLSGIDTYSDKLLKDNAYVVYTFGTKDEIRKFRKVRAKPEYNSKTEYLKGIAGGFGETAVSFALSPQLGILMVTNLTLRCGVFGYKKFTGKLENFDNGNLTETLIDQPGIFGVVRQQIKNYKKEREQSKQK